jgi:hypothetical protein
MLTTTSKFLWGPLCLVTAAAGVTRSPLRHPLRVIACMAHLYGVALYYATSLTELWLTGRAHSRPEPLYFWGYYVGFNLPWVIVPGRKSYPYTSISHPSSSPSPPSLLLSVFGEQLGADTSPPPSTVLLCNSFQALSRKLRSLESVKAGLDGFQARNGDVTTAVAAAAAAAAARAQNKRDPW